jgi:peptidoglycan/xylan/chitin deacetylase (PgdA/CDA1 family)
MGNGKFIISLDFELHWGVRDKLSIEQYGDNIKGVHQAIPLMLDIFSKYGIHATFATVGLLFFETKQDLLQHLPANKPTYNNRNLSPYEYMNSIGNSYKEDVYHYAPLLIKRIQQHPQHEIGTHTFSHYYCLEKGQTLADFKADIEAAKKAASKFGIELTSLVFPRNQFNDAYLALCKEAGITAIRGNETSWLYTARNDENESLVRRAFRLLDSYVNLSGHHCYDGNKISKALSINIPSSRFLRPFSPRLKKFDALKLKRITSAMTYAAKNGLVYHLWWHPHNFGIHQTENFSFLEKILQHYKRLNEQYQFQSCTMRELANQIVNNGR